MLFNSFPFIFLFLPATVLGFFLLAKISRLVAAAWLTLASIFFYGWWSPKYVPLLLASILFNYGMGWVVGHSKGKARFRWLSFAVAANLLLLGYYKYADFFISSVNALAQTSFPLLNVVLPIGISFFTFTQIAFLVDTYQGKVNEYRLIHYTMFVTYFPHLVAGPVLHHKEMMPQFAERAPYQISARNFAVGLSIFVIGLAKKVLLADSLAPHANFLFDHPDSPSLLVAWGGTLAYAFQLYFDFSGYSDMAIGISRLFGIQLPLNFNSPYKSVNIVEFWRRWHMTLSRFLRDYLYIPLGGNRKGPISRYLNLMLTMLLGGLWHGAAWNFVIWGALHGSYLMINHAWQRLSVRLGFPSGSGAWRVCAVALTFASACLAWTFFRANTLDGALDVCAGMFGKYGVGLPEALGLHLGGLRTVLENWGVHFYLGYGERFVQTYLWVGLGAAVAFLLPNTQQLMDKFEPALDYAPAVGAQHARRLGWRPSRYWAFLIGLLFTGSLLSLNQATAFLYFQF